MATPFRFYTRLNLTELLGRKAADLKEFLEGLKSVPGSSIYYHTHRFLQQHHFLSPEPPNDFAYWVSMSLKEERLGEKLAAVDIVRFGGIAPLRESFISIIEEHIKHHPAERRAPDGEEFHFMKSVTFVVPTPHVVDNLRDFYETLGMVSIHSVYFHIFEARLRLEKGDNDFSFWLGTQLGEKEIAAAVAKMDPYTRTLENLRQRIRSLIKDKIR